MLRNKCKQLSRYTVLDMLVVYTTTERSLHSIWCVWGEEGGRETNKKCHITANFWNILLPLQDPKEEALGAAKKRCKLGESSKRTAYESPEGLPPRKRTRAEGDEGDISVFHSDEELDENLVSSQVPVALHCDHNSVLSHAKFSQVTMPSWWFQPWLPSLA